MASRAEVKVSVAGTIFALVGLTFGAPGSAVGAQPPAIDQGPDERPDADPADAAPTDEPAEEPPRTQGASIVPPSSEDELPRAEDDDEVSDEPPATVEDEASSPAERVEETSAAAEEEVSGEPGESSLTMDDIFGTPEEHADVPTQAEAREEAASAPPASGLRRLGQLRRKLAKTLDFRFRLVSSVYFAVARTDEPHIERNENRLEFRLAYKPSRHIELVGDIEAVFFGVSQVSTLGDLSDRGRVTPFHLESDAAYVGLYDLLPNLDIKIGRQIVKWGTADLFNPTNNINPDDLEDRPLFTEPIANQMVVVNWAPLDDWLWFQGVYVPFFVPALLPPSAAQALEDPYAPVPFSEQEDIDQIEAARDLFNYDPGLIPVVTSTVRMPKRRFVDGQSAIKVGSNFGGAIDVSLSYYNGRHDIPAPVEVVSAFKTEATGEPGTPYCCVDSHVTLVYPRIQVIGLDFATQLPFAGNMGFWGEAGLFFPSQKDLYIEFPRPQDVTPDDGMNNPVTSVEGPSIESTPYVKATIGVDYTFGKHVYVQAQYLRGFIDEIGASHIGNYLVAGAELSFLGRHVVFRLFGVVDFPTGKGDDGSGVVYPALMLKPPWGYATLELGGFVLMGKDDTKFGQKAAGSSIVFAKIIGEF